MPRVVAVPTTARLGSKLIRRPAPTAMAMVWAGSRRAKALRSPSRRLSEKQGAAGQGEAFMGFSVTSIGG